MIEYVYIFAALVQTLRNESFVFSKRNYFYLSP